MNTPSPKTGHLPRPAKSQTMLTAPALQPHWGRIAQLGLIIGVSALIAACGGSSGSSGTPGTATVPTQPPQPTPIPQSAPLEIRNISNNDTIRYSLPILNGRTTQNVNTVTLENAGKQYQAEVLDGEFKAMIPLQTGANQINIKAGDKSISTRINYLPATNTNKVRMMYAIAADDDGRFLAEPGVPNGIEQAKAKIALEALLMQSATAEMMFKGTGQRITWALVEDDNGKPLVSTLRLPLTRAQLYQQNDQELYQVIADALKAANLFDGVKSMVTMGFTNYANGKTLGHAALGGGNLGIFGGLHLHTCPDTLDQLTASFSNTTRIDTRVFPDDSGGRETYWANCATGMGASLHELGHTFDLPHTPTGIMSRGFDNFNRLFMLREPGFTSVITTNNEAGAIWDPASVQILLRNRWFKQ